MNRAHIRELAWLILLFLDVAALRLDHLLGPTDRLLRSDKATKGMMALDILRGRPVPFFQYGQG